MLSSQFSDVRYIKTQSAASVIAPDQVISEALKARSVLQAPTTPFQRLLERMMFEQIQEGRDQHNPTPDPSLLTVNPHMNIRAVMAAHPEQEVFYADGAIRVQEAVARAVLPPVSHIPVAPQTPLIPPAITDTQPFQQIIAPTAVAALAMGSGLRARAEVSHPDHLSYLFKRTASTPVGKVSRAYLAENQHTFWDK